MPIYWSEFEGILLSNIWNIWGFEGGGMRILCDDPFSDWLLDTKWKYAQ